MVKHISGFFYIMRTIKCAIAIIAFHFFPRARLDSCRELLWTSVRTPRRIYPLALILQHIQRATCTCACRTYIRTQKWSELHRLARLRIHPRSRWGVPGVRDQLGRTAGSISQKGLPTVSRWRHRRRWSDSSITDQNSWDRLRLVGTYRATRSDCLYSQLWRAVIAEKCCPVFKNPFTRHLFIPGELDLAAPLQKR